MKLVVLALLTSSAALAQGCFPLDKKLSFSGRLVMTDENGYRQWMGLRLSRPVCVQGDRGDGYIERVDDVKIMQAFAPEDGPIHSRLNRLIGNNVALTGTLAQWLTAYQRAPVVINVDTVEPTDAAGEAALHAPDRPKPLVRDVPAYYITVRAGQSLTKAVREAGSNRPLTPVDEYARHAVTGGDVVYVFCRDGYEPQYVGGSISEDSAICGASANSCGFNMPRDGTTTLTMRCTKAK